MSARATSSRHAATPTDAAERACDACLRRAYERGHVSARGHHRVLRVARTIADLAGSQGVARVHVAEALSYRRQPPRA